MSRPGGRSHNKRPPDIGLLMECYDEELSTPQTGIFTKVDTEYKEAEARLQAMMKSQNAELVHKGDKIYVIQLENLGEPLPMPSLSATTPITGNAANSPATRQSAMIAQPSPGTAPTVVQAMQSPVILQGPTPAGGVVTRAGTGNAIPGGTYQLMMDPRLGLIVGTVTSAQPTPGSPVIQTTTSLAKAPHPVQVTAATPQTRSSVQTRNMTPRGAQQPTPTGKQGVMPGKQPGLPAPVKSAANATTPNLRGKGKGQQATPSSRPTENNVIGGLSTGGKSNWKNNNNNNNTVAPIVDLTNDDRPVPVNAPDSREVTFNKLSGKTFPSLVVVARPNMRVKEIPPSQVSAERTALDQKVKSVLMFTPTKFTEWLIQQGLVRSEQYCSSHMGTDNTPVKLKLGMYSDVSKFPYSGGYVWISECCPQRFVSVFSGSIFEGAPHPPTVLLKLIYHWSCQTNVQNVVQWVKVDNFYVKNFFTNMRSICTAAVHEKYEKMGGLRKRVEVGVISLGTTSQDGNMRQVKVEVLGVMDPESKLIRLRAVEPLQDGERNYKKRFVKILEPLEQWVDRDSIILTDFTVDKGTLHGMGFNSVYQVSITDTPAPQNKYSNQNVMEYLRRIVPRMFQNTLSLLSRQIIQQFLDELVWRERWGPVASQAFESIISHLSEQTKLETGESDNLLARLSNVASSPFKLWNYASWKKPVTNGLPPAPASKPTKAPPAAAPAPAPAPPPPEPPRPVGIDMLPQSIRTVEPPPTTGAKRGRKRALPNADASVPDPKRGAAQESKRATVPDPKRAVLPDPSPQLPEEQTALDSYYYGTYDGDQDILSSELKTTTSIKCCMCQRSFANNIALMKHLIMHAQLENQFSSELSDVTQCKYCLKSFPTPFSMQTHMEEMHLKASTGLVCRICEEKFRDRSMLIGHMHRIHVALELPYSCGICKFRSSMHRDVIDHFYELHNNGEKLQCPFCLKTVAFSNQGRKMSANINFFLNHILKHQRKSIARKCNKCVLWFVHKGILREHQLKDHVSYKGIPGVKMFIHPSGADVMMPVPPPVGMGARGVLAQKNMSNYPKLRSSYTSRNFESLAIYCNTDGSTCCECEGDFMGEDHFPGCLFCSRCRYSTCCSKAMAEHVVVFHDSGKPSPEFTLGRVIRLPREMFCVCGFSSMSGNRLAKHLARCERKSAYPSPSRAKAATLQSASFPPLVTLDDADNASEDPSDRWLKAFVPARKDDQEVTRDPPEKKPLSKEDSVDPPSMLNILGLVRKPSTDESSLDRAASDSEGPPELKAEEPMHTAVSPPIPKLSQDARSRFTPIFPRLLNTCLYLLGMSPEPARAGKGAEKSTKKPEKQAEKKPRIEKIVETKPDSPLLTEENAMEVDTDPPVIDKMDNFEDAAPEGDSEELDPAALLDATMHEDSTELPDIAVGEPGGTVPVEKDLVAADSDERDSEPPGSLETKLDVAEESDSAKEIEEVKSPEQVARDAAKSPEPMTTEPCLEKVSVPLTEPDADEMTSPMEVEPTEEEGPVPTAVEPTAEKTPVPTAMEADTEEAAVSTPMEADSEEAPVLTAMEADTEEAQVPTAEKSDAEETPVPTAEESDVEEAPVPTAEESDAEEAPVPSAEGLDAEEAPVLTAEGSDAEEAPVPTAEGSDAEEAAVPTAEGSDAEEAPVPTAEEAAEEPDAEVAPVSTTMEADTAEAPEPTAVEPPAEKTAVAETPAE